MIEIDVYGLTHGGFDIGCHFFSCYACQEKDSVHSLFSSVFDCCFVLFDRKRVYGIFPINGFYWISSLALMKYRARIDE